MIIFCLVILFISVIYLAVGLYTQNELRQEMAVEIEAAKEAINEAEEQFEEFSRPLLERIAIVFGEETAADIQNETIAPGMPEEFLLLAWGDPEDIDSSYVRGTNTETWYYDPEETENGQVKYLTEVVITNNRITGIQNN